MYVFLLRLFYLGGKIFGYGSFDRMLVSSPKCLIFTIVSLTVRDNAIDIQSKGSTMYVLNGTKILDA